MSLLLQTNVTSLVAQQNLGVNSTALDNTITRLTSGFRINKSGDDAAGLAVANGYRANVTVLQQGVRNANDGTSILQIVDGGLNNISNILNQLQQLAAQSASGTFSGSRSTLDQEFQTLLGEIDRQAASIGLASGSGAASQYNTSIAVYIGGGDTQTHSQVSINLSGSANLVDTNGLGLSGGAVDTVTHAQTAITNLTNAIKALGLVQGAIGDGENQLTYAIGLATSQITNLSAAEADIRDANVAEEASKLTQGQILQQTSVAALAQANSEPQSLLKLLQ